MDDNDVVEHHKDNSVGKPLVDATQRDRLGRGHQCLGSGLVTLAQEAHAARKCQQPSSINACNRGWPSSRDNRNRHYQSWHRPDSHAIKVLKFEFAQSFIQCMSNQQWQRCNFGSNKSNDARLHCTRRAGAKSGASRIALFHMAQACISSAQSARGPAGAHENDAMGENVARGALVAQTNIPTSTQPGEAAHLATQTSANG